MKIFGLTVGRNEAHRYLSPMLENSHPLFDGHFFYDDRSEDSTVEIAVSKGCAVSVRPEGAPSFVDSAGLFRGGAWSAFEAVINPVEGDWVMVMDCDEALVTPQSCGTEAVRSALEQSVHYIASVSCVAGDLKVPEVFGFDPNGTPLTRMDGFWGGITVCRLFAYHEGGTYPSDVMGETPVPLYALQGARTPVPFLFLMHYGYSHEPDHRWKYERYSGQTGHSNTHVESIISPNKDLVPWTGPFYSNMRHT